MTLDWTSHESGVHLTPTAPMPESSIINGRIESGRCHVEVVFGLVTPEGCVLRYPAERTALDTLSPGITITRDLAQRLGMTFSAETREERRPSIQQVAYVVYTPDGEIAWQAEAKAMVTDARVPASLGMAQLLKWHLTIDGPAGTFELRIPAQKR